MANDVNIDIGIDLNQLKSDINKAAVSVKQQFEKKLELQIQTTEAKKAINSLAGTFQNLTKETAQSSASIKNAMASLIIAGKDGTKEFKELEIQLRKVTADSKQLDDAMDKVNKSIDGVGNNSGLGKLKQGFSDFVSNFKGGLIAGAIAGVGVAMKEVISLGIDFQSSLAEFSAITGVSGKALEDFGEKAKNLSVQFGGSALDQITAFKGILSRLGPDIAKSPEALERMTIAVNTLAKAGGIDAQTSMDALTTAMLQMGVSLDDPLKAAEAMASMMNVMAAGAKEGAAEIPQISEALVASGAAAKASGVSFLELNAAIQVMAQGGKYGAEAGTAIRNVMIKLQEQSKEAEGSLKAVGLSGKGLATALSTGGLSSALDMINKKFNETSDPLKKNQVLIDLFGAENLAAGATLVSHAKELDKFKIKMAGTNTAFEQAAINMNTWQGSIDRAKAKLEKFGLDIFKAIEAPVSAVINTITTIVSGIYDVVSVLFTEIWEATKPLRDAFESLFTEIGRLFGGIGDGKKILDVIIDVLKFFAEIIGNVVGFQIQVATFAFKIFINLLTFGIKIFNNVVDWFKELAKSGTLVGDVVNWIADAFMSVIKWVGGAIQKVLEFFGLLDKKPPEVKVKTKVETPTQEEIKKALAPTATNPPTVKVKGKIDLGNIESFVKDVSSIINKTTEAANKLLIDNQIKNLENLRKMNTENTLLSARERFEIENKIDLQILDIKNKNAKDAADNALINELISLEEKYQANLKEIKGKSNFKALKLQLDEEYNKANESLNINHNNNLKQLDSDYLNSKTDLEKEASKKRIEIANNEFKALEIMAKNPVGFGGIIAKMFGAGDFVKVKEDVKDLGLTITETFGKLDFEKIFEPLKEATEKTNEKVQKDFANSKTQLDKDLKDQALSYEEYIDKNLELNEQLKNNTLETQSAMKKGWLVLTNTLSQVFDAFKEKMTVLQAVGAQVGLSLLQVAVEGGNVGKALAQSLLQALPQIIAAHAATIFGAFASLGIWAIPAGLAAIATLYGLASVAYGSETGDENVGKTSLKPRGKSDIHLRWLANEEIVVNRNTANLAGNRELISRSMKTGIPISQLINPSISGVSVNDNGDLVNEIRGVRNELKQAKLIETYHNNKIIVEDNRKIQVKQLEWSGR